MSSMWFSFFNDTATTEIYTLSLHDALPIYRAGSSWAQPGDLAFLRVRPRRVRPMASGPEPSARPGGMGCPPPSRRSEEPTSELQSRQYLVCRLLLEKKNFTI